ncbi:MAG: energy-coupling factor transporter transmembrane component T [Actinomycetes bacterium]
MSSTRPSALGSARTAVAGAWFAVVMAVALALDHPLALVSLLVGLVSVALLTGSGRPLGRAAVWTVPMAVTVALLNALLSRDGLTVVARLGELPVLGRLDVTLEGLAYGGVLALRVTLVAAAVAVFAACVDQDSVVGLLRRRSGRFGIAIALAGRMAPLLAADAKRMSQARRTLGSEVAPSRAALLSALVGGALDRSVDAASALELRGLGDGPCLVPPSRRPWSRHDFSLSISAAALAALVILGSALGWLDASWRPQLAVTWGIGAFVVAALLPLVAAMPLLDRRGVVR